MKTFEIRGIQLRTEEREQKKYLRGTIPYNSKSHDLGGFTEVITPTAFNKTLKDGKNVYALLDHSREKILGNTRSNTVKLESTPAGLEVEVEVPGTTYALDAYTLIERGITNGMSFGFYPVKHKDDPTTRTRFLEEVKLEEVSFLISQDPAYPQTSAGTYLRSFVEDEKINFEELENAFSKIKAEQLNENEQDILRKFIDSVGSFVKPKEAVESAAKTTDENTSDDLDKLNLILESEKLLLEL